jgi:hypothetical protein
MYLCPDTRGTWEASTGERGTLVCVDGECFEVTEVK